jgi:hypothetical protein
VSHVHDVRVECRPARCRSFFRVSSWWPGAAGSWPCLGGWVDGGPHTVSYSMLVVSGRGGGRDPNDIIIPSSQQGNNTQHAPLAGVASRWPDAARGPLQRSGHWTTSESNPHSCRSRACGPCFPGPPRHCRLVGPRVRDIQRVPALHGPRGRRRQDVNVGLVPIVDGDSSLRLLALLKSASTSSRPRSPGTALCGPLAC